MRVYASVYTVALLLGASSVPRAEGQTTWYVDDDNCPGPGTGTPANPFCVIQDGIDAANIGATVLVYDGVYSGFGNKNLDFGGKDITLRSAGGQDNCIIDCEDNGRGFDFHSGETNEAVVTGFTITRGSVAGMWPMGSGGGVSCYTNSSPTLANCTITGNTAGAHGGGVWCAHNSAPKLINCTITANTAHYGGGVNCLYGSSPTLRSCTITGNMATGAYAYGGGVLCCYASSPTLTNCVITANSSTGTGEPGGGGIHCCDRSSPALVNCTITGNTAGAHGGGVVSAGTCSPTLTNCILWNNQAGSAPQAYMIRNSSLSIRYSDVEEGTMGIYVEAGCELEWGAGNIDADPLFLDADGLDDIPGTEDDDLRLSAGSPCIDAADNSAVPIGVTTDLDGNPRFFDDPHTPDTGNGTPPIVDMGAYESLGLCGNGVVDTGEECDDGGESAMCDANCTFAECGDGTFNATAGEECDDAGDSVTCDSDCTIAECGDGTLNVTAGEECDDAGESAACDSDCTVAECGDGTLNVTTGEECDDGMDNSDTEPDTCRADCREPWCGDAVVDTGEECDDGNTASGDGCGGSCRIEFGACCAGIAGSYAVEPDCLDSGGAFFGYNSTCDVPDTDADGLRDECDGCPEDPNKIEPGVCGCGRDDNADSDGDGVPDCNDQCLGIDDAIFAPDCIDGIPTVSTWGLVILGLLLLVGHKIHFSRRAA